VARWTKRTELPVKQFLTWLELGISKFYDWRERFGKVNEHNSQVPRDTWLEDWEKQAIVAYHEQHPLEGYRRLAYMMLDADVVAVSASSVYRVLRAAGLLDRHNTKPSLKGTGFVQPLKAHQHWHVDIAFVNIANTFYFLCSILDGYSRAIVHWELRPKMEEQDVEVILQRAREKYPGVNPRIISDNGPQFIAKDFKQFIRVCGMTHVRTSPYYPQSNGKLERFHRTIKGDCLRPACPATLEEAQRHVTRYVAHYNHVRLHSAIGYVTPEQKLAGMEQDIFHERDRKLAEARQRRAEKWREVAA
jgi:putative transposase